MAWGVLYTSNKALGCITCALMLASNGGCLGVMIMMCALHVHGHLQCK